MPRASSSPSAQICCSRHRRRLNLVARFAKKWAIKLDLARCTAHGGCASLALCAMGLSAVMAFWQAWWLSVALAVVTVLVVRRWYLKDPAQDHGLPLEWNGWRSISRSVRCRASEHHRLKRRGRSIPCAWSQWTPGAWAVSMGALQERQAVYAWCIELRHRSRGPCGHAVRAAQRSAAHGRAAGHGCRWLIRLAQRLGIRRSGSRLRAAKTPTIDHKAVGHRSRPATEHKENTCLTF